MALPLILLIFFIFMPIVSDLKRHWLNATSTLLKTEDLYSFPEANTPFSGPAIIPIRVTGGGMTDFSPHISAIHGSGLNRRFAPDSPMRRRRRNKSHLR